MSALHSTRATWLFSAIVALAVTMAYFAITKSWTDLGNPIASLVAVVAGVLGFGGAVLVSRSNRSPSGQ